jgi:hypothetical protein
MRRFSFGRTVRADWVRACRSTWSVGAGLGGQQHLPALPQQDKAAFRNTKPPGTLGNCGPGFPGLPRRRRAALKLSYQPVQVGKSALPIPRRQRPREIEHGQLP